eukprot:TRINITY_DN4219_c0_g1_i1.p1 TRINITY_DN4219_c0_g1~~TRINITY_DN4219_c0_g1_i1.p1  ORF type:complete len:510 (-),score=136.33 TRINITY_DN4219_c0_g1_i1:50-1579(-)
MQQGSGKGTKGQVLIKGGTVVNSDRQFKADVLITEGIITQVSPSISLPESTPNLTILDATNKLVIPGGIDTHTHCQLPFMGTVAVDDFNYGTRAALAGGTTMLLDFVIPTKGESIIAEFHKWRSWADPKVNCDYSFHVAITDWNPSTTPQEMKTLTESHGVNSFKMFMAYKGWAQLTDSELYSTFKVCKQLGAIAQVHAENGDVIHHSQKELLALGITGPEGHCLSRPESLEGEATNRAITIADSVNTPVYIVHVMSAAAAEAVRRAKKNNIRVFGEPIAAGLGTDASHCWHHAWDHAVRYIMSPPLRTPETKELLMKYLAEGVLSCVGTDNCTFNIDQKALGKDDFTKIPNGVNGIEDRMSIVWTNGVKKGVLTKEQFVGATSSIAARIFGVYPRKGVIEVGSDGDVVVWNGERKRVISKDTHHHKCDFNVFEGMEVYGVAEATVSKGEVVWKDGEFTERCVQGRGEYVNRKCWSEYVFDGMDVRDEVRDPLKFKVEREPYTGPVTKI